MSTLQIELHFCPTIEYFILLDRYENILLEKQENYIKQTFRNRTYILTSNGIGRLTIPLIGNHDKIPISEIEIDHTTRWQTIFWRTLESAYAKAPFFEHYADDVNKILFSGEKKLFNLNKQFLSMCLQWLNWRKELSETVVYEKVLSPEITDARNWISAKKDFTSRGVYLPRPYQQVFGNNFAPNLSLLDLIFCEGPNAAALISASQELNK